MQSIVATKSAHSTDAVLEPVPWVGTLSGPRTEAWRQRIVNLTLIFSDVVLALVIWEVACTVQVLLRGPGYLSGIAIMSVVPVTLVWVGVRAIQGLYPGYGVDEAEELRRQTYALLATLAFTAIFALAFQIGDTLSRLLLALAFSSLLLLSPFTRHFMKKWMMRHGVWGKPVAILSAGDARTRVKELLNQEWGLGFRPVALFEGQPEGSPAEVKEGDEGRPDEDIMAEAVELSRKHRLDTLFLAMPHVPREYLAKLADLASIQFRSVVIIPDLAGVTNSAVVARNFAGTLGVEVRHNLLHPWIRRFKRGLDFIGTLVGGLFISPLLLATFILIKLDSSGPALFVQERPGLNGEMFRVFKFRTMHVDAEQRLERLFLENPILAQEFEMHGKLKDDPRVTRVGKWLRKLSVDELPQLWNVLRGEMSLVGPRPYLVSQVSQMNGNDTVISRIAPGISGLWQVSGRSETTFEERVDLDIYYVRNWSVWLDLMILARTVRCVLFGSGAY